MASQTIGAPPDYWAQASDHLAAADEAMAGIVRAFGDAGQLSSRGDPFNTLARSIIGQQISVKAAQAVWLRFEKAAGKVTPELRRRAIPVASHMIATEELDPALAASLIPNGRTLGENLEDAKIYNDDVIRRRNNPLAASGGLAVLRGNLAPDGAVIKPTAAEPHLMKHTGPAVVFKNYDDLYARIDDENLVVDENSVLVLQNAGPQGGPGMPEWGQLPIPKKLLQKGVRDMVRISDARMSGTSYGACVLHVAPESYVGGPLALVRDGDLIEMDVAARKLELKVSAEELARRKAAWKQPEPHYTRGYGAIYSQHITQANKGCDLDILHHGKPTPDPEVIH